MKFLDLGLLNLSYDMCKKGELASLFATFGENIGFEGLPAYRKKFGCLPLSPPAPWRGGVNGVNKSGLVVYLKLAALDSSSSTSMNSPDQCPFTSLLT